MSPADARRSSRLLRAQRCAECGGLRTRIFTLGPRYICTGCVGRVVADLHPEWTAEARAAVVAHLRKELED
jgi:hypothetical protein